MLRRLPPFAALRAFEAAARHNNFKKAAEDLCLSASAVSHQVRSLEEYLGVQLFHREKGKPQLTHTGSVYLEAIQDIFTRLENATSAITERSKKPTLVLHLLHSLASCWLISLLPHLKQRHPDLDIQLISALDEAEFRTADIDVAIRYGDGNWAGLCSNFLMEDELFLVCSPELAEQLPPLENLEQLSDQTLIHCSLDQEEWKQWLQAAGTGAPNDARRLDLDSRGLVLEAAAGGMGLAIGRMPYVANYLTSGRLVTPYPVRVKTGKGYYLVYPKHHSTYDTVVKLREWLLEICAPDHID